MHAADDSNRALASRGLQVRMRARLVCAVLLVFFTWPSRAEACKCRGPVPACQATWEHTAAFVARVTQFSRTLDSEVIEFDVLEAFRGVETGQLVMTVPLTSCSPAFEAGGEYVIYASGPADRLTTSMCSGNRVVTDAFEDLAYLRGLAGMADRMLGEMRGSAQVLGADGRRSPLAGHAVTLTGSGTTQTVRTGPDGGFSAMVPADTYVLTIDADAPLVAISAPFSAVLRDPRGCVVADLFFDGGSGRR